MRSDNQKQLRIRSYKHDSMKPLLIRYSFNMRPGEETGSNLLDGQYSISTYLAEPYPRTLLEELVKIHLE